MSNQQDGRAVTHYHIGRLTKRELVIHVQTPHSMPNGRVQRVAMSTASLERWGWYELNQAHEGLHQELG